MNIELVLKVVVILAVVGAVIGAVRHWVNLRNEARALQRESAELEGRIKQANDVVAHIARRNNQSGFVDPQFLLQLTGAGAFIMALTILLTELGKPRKRTVWALLFASSWMCAIGVIGFLYSLYDLLVGGGV